MRSLSELRHHESLRWADQRALRLRFEGSEGPENEVLKKHLEKLWETKDWIGAHLKPKEVKELMGFNGMSVEGKAGAAWLQHRLADAMVWGRIGHCPKCKCDALAHNGVEYVCYGHVSEFTRCDYRGNDASIVRYKFRVPPKKQCPKALLQYEFSPDHPKQEMELKVATRDDDSSAGGADAGADADDEDDGKKKKKAAAGKKKKKGGDDLEDDEKTDARKKIKSSGSVVSSAQALGPSSLSSILTAEPEDVASIPNGKEMFGMKVALAGAKAGLGQTLAQLKIFVEEHGGEVVNKVDASTSALVTSADEITKKKPSVKVTSARDAGVAILSIDWLMNLCNRKDEGLKLRAMEHSGKYVLEAGKSGDAPEKYRLAARYDGEKKREREVEEQVIKLREKPVAGSDILKLPEGISKGEILVTHDTTFGYTPYNAVLNQADVATGINKFYKISIVKSSAKRYVVYCRWGRIGVADKGGDMEKIFTNEADAIEFFASKFFDCTNFRWDKRYRYKKQPGRYFWVRLDDGVQTAKDVVEGDKGLKKLKLEGLSKQVSGNAIIMHPKVREFVALICDKNMMTNTLLKFKVDVKRMPLGRISPDQLRQGYSMLGQIANILKTSNDRTLLADASNAFYMLIPHDFGLDSPPLIDSLEALKIKMNLVEALIEIDSAVEIIADENSKDPILESYVGLRAIMTPLDHESDRFKLISDYVHKGHDGSGFNFGMRVREVFELRRQDETEDYPGKWKKEANRWLLWHGSRLSNWCGIIRNGLRIAPKEAPSTGYRLGKGIYLADTVSKSGSYCFTDSANSTGVMLLGEAALGRQWQTLQDKYMEEPEPGFDSTYALGQVAPDPAATVKIEGLYGSEVSVPVGEPKRTSHKKSNFTHDELVVYDVKQVSMRYVLIVDFDHSGKKRRK